MIIAMILYSEHKLFVNPDGKFAFHPTHPSTDGYALPARSVIQM
jgi:hypothetical protein